MVGYSRNPGPCFKCGKWVKWRKWITATQRYQYHCFEHREVTPLIPDFGPDPDPDPDPVIAQPVVAQLIDIEARLFAAKG